MCGQNLFESSTKFDSGSGWPAFYDVIDENSIKLTQDASHGNQSFVIDYLFYFCYIFPWLKIHMLFPGVSFIISCCFLKPWNEELFCNECSTIVSMSTIFGFNFVRMLTMIFLNDFFPAVCLQSTPRDF